MAIYIKICYWRIIEMYSNIDCNINSNNNNNNNNHYSNQKTIVK